jgi:hypothetical protein
MKQPTGSKSFSLDVLVRFVPRNPGWQKTWLDMESIVGLDARNAQRALGLKDKEYTRVTMTLTKREEKP